MVELKVRQLFGVRNRVIHQRPGEQLPAFIVDDFLEKCLRQTLRDAAVHLTFDDHRVDQRTAVIDREVFFDPHLAGARVDLDHADVRAERKHEVRRLEPPRCVEARLETRRQMVAHEGEEAGFRSRHRLRGIALHADLALAIFQVVRIGFPLMRGDRNRFGLDRLDGHLKRCAADRRSARTEGADAVLHFVGVAVDHAHVIDRNAEFVGDDLGKGRLLPLTVR